MSKQINYLPLILSLYCLPIRTSKNIISKIEDLIEKTNQPIELKVIENIEQILSSEVESIPALMFNNKVYSLIDNVWLYDGANKVHIEQLFQVQ